MYSKLEGGFGSVLPMWSLGAKNGSKPQSFTPFDSSRPADHFDVVECQNCIKMAELCPFNLPKLGQKPRSGLFWAENGYLWHIFWDTDFKFVLPIIYINIKGKSIGPRLTISSSTNHKCQLPKSLLLLHFYFQNRCKHGSMDFASGFLI